MMSQDESWYNSQTLYYKSYRKLENSDSSSGIGM